MEKWIGDTLSKCLDCVVTNQMMTAILNISNDLEFDNYFGNLLNADNEEHRLFLLNCRRMLLSGKQPRSNNNQKSKQSAPTKQPIFIHKNSSGAYKNTQKLVSLYTADGKFIGDQIMFKERRCCDCQASRHKLINNCLACGRIVCMQEGSGPCLYCGELVYTPEEEKQLAKNAPNNNKNSGKASGKPQKKEKHMEKQVKGKKDSTQGLQQALAQRDRLLEYDRNSEKRTTVIDDELDYFQENSVWLTDAEREKYEQLKSEMHELKHGSRLKRKIKVDFAGRELPEDLPIGKEYEQQMMREIANASKEMGAASAIGLTGHSSLGLPGNLDLAQAPLFKPTNDASLVVTAAQDNLERIYNRVQDKELMEMQDMRQCLSMHQPWASLLVAGIKKHEGRVWYSEHRGRLWIASTAKEPHSDDIVQMEEFYRLHYNDPNLEFPKHYPTSSLLGCVNVENCMPQEEYRELFPSGESDSPYVFVCTKPEQLPMLLPVQGAHKIYELPLKTHNAACKTLLRCRVNKS